LPERAAVALAAARARLGAELRARLPGETGAFAAAIAVGDRSGVPQDALSALRDSNLAHLLAISGLHMALVCGAVFGALRLGLALWPGVALRWPVKRIAAAGAFVAGAAYLLLSGAGTPTQRAYAMAAAALMGVIANRQAVTVRALAAAALLVLALAPESLLSVGFQMSFAATLALVATYEGARARGWLAPDRGVGRQVLRYAAGIALTSLIAGAATAPFAAAHFNRLTSYGFFANLLAVPALGLWAAPALLIGAVAAPFGAEGPFLAVAGAGIEWILGVARFFAGLDAAVRPVAAAPAVAFGLIVIGGLWLFLWRSAMRWGGAGAIAIGLALWVGAAERPLALIAPGGALVGVMTPEGRSLDHARAAGYAAETWLRRDGDAATQASAAARPFWRREDGATSADLGEGWTVIRLVDRARRDDLVAACDPRVLLIAPRNTRAPSGPCVALDRTRLAEDGALAVSLSDGALRLRSARDASGDRLWTGTAPQ
jgi:competence protein ComEC